MLSDKQLSKYQFMKNSLISLYKGAKGILLDFELPIGEDLSFMPWNKSQPSRVFMGPIMNAFR